MLDRISIELFYEWMAYAELEPFGEERADLRSAIVATVMANAWAGKGKKYKPADFMPKFPTAANMKQQSGKQIEAILRAQLGAPPHGEQANG